MKSSDHSSSDLTPLLLGRKKIKVNEEVSIAREITEREIAGLEYLGGYILRHSYAGLRKSKHWYSNEYQNMMALVKSCQSMEKPQSQKLTAALDRNSLWYTKEKFPSILVKAEKIFCFAILNRKEVGKIEHNQIIQKMMDNEEIVEIFEELTSDCDFEVDEECRESVLRRILQLFVSMRSYNFAKDTVQKFKLKNAFVKKPLRKTLKDIDNMEKTSA